MITWYFKKSMLAARPWVDPSDMDEYLQLAWVHFMRSLRGGASKATALWRAKKEIRRTLLGANSARYTVLRKYHHLAPPPKWCSAHDVVREWQDDTHDPPEQRVFIDPREGPETMAALLELYSALKRQLAPRDWQMVSLYTQGWTMKEIGTWMRITESRVCQRLSKILKAIRQGIGEETDAKDTGNTG